MTDREYQELLKAYDTATGAERDRLWAIITNPHLTTTSKLTGG